MPPNAHGEFRLACVDSSSVLSTSLIISFSVGSHISPFNWRSVCLLVCLEYWIYFSVMMVGGAEGTGDWDFSISVR